MGIDRQHFEKILNWCLNPLLYCLPSDYGEVTFIGSGILSEHQLLRVARLLQAQAKTIQEPGGAVDSRYS